MSTPVGERAGGAKEVSWEEFAGAAPRIAAGGAELLTQHGPGLGYLATVRSSDGGPRVHPCCPTIAEGRLWVFVGPSPKLDDLRADARYALHTFPKVDSDDEFFLRGRAREHDPDPRLRDAIRAANEATIGSEGEVLFELLVERALLARYRALGAFPPDYHRWAAPGV